MSFLKMLPDFIRIFLVANSGMDQKLKQQQQKRDMLNYEAGLREGQKKIEERTKKTQYDLKNPGYSRKWTE